jgi:hypothetical protein
MWHHRDVVQGKAACFSVAVKERPITRHSHQHFAAAVI